MVLLEFGHKVFSSLCYAIAINRKETPYEHIVLSDTEKRG